MCFVFLVQEISMWNTILQSFADDCYNSHDINAIRPTDCPVAPVVFYIESARVVLAP